MRKKERESEHPSPVYTQRAKTRRRSAGTKEREDRKERSEKGGCIGEERWNTPRAERGRGRREPWMLKRSGRASGMSAANEWNEIDRDRESEREPECRREREREGER